MQLKNQREYFNQTASQWTEVDARKLKVIKSSLSLLKISPTTKILDVACGTGVLYPLLMQIPVSKYLGLDISEGMLAEFRKLCPEAKLICENFNQSINLQENFDLIVIFNSIPHFKNLELVFANAQQNLVTNGKFSIIHARTRQGLREHHQKIGYHSKHEPIPSDQVLTKLAEKFGFCNTTLLDEEFFFFSGEKSI